MGIGSRSILGPLPIYDHGNTLGHHISVDNFSIVGGEAHSITRTIKEAIYIRINDPSLNRYIGKFQLPHIWDEVLQDTLPSISCNTFTVAIPQQATPSLCHIKVRGSQNSHLHSGKYDPPRWCYPP